MHAALTGLGKEAAAEPAGPAKPTPAQIRKSITPDTLISFEDGKSYKTMRRHLNLRGLSPDAYRAKWGLPANYPMTTAAYSAKRSELARALGLGQQRRNGAAAAAKAASVSDKVSDASKPRGRPRKAVEGAGTAPKPHEREKVAETA